MSASHRDPKAISTAHTTSLRWRVSWFLVWAMTLTLCLLSVASLLSRYHWLAEMLANLRVQLVLALSIALVIAGVARNKKATILLVTVLCWQGWGLRSAFIANDAPIPRVATTDGSANQPLKVMTINVLAVNQRLDDVVRQISSAEADIVAVLELSTPLADRITKQLQASHPFASVHPQDPGNFGIGLWSRFPLRDDHSFILNRDWNPSVEATVECPSGSIHIIATHPVPPMNRNLFETRNDHMSMLARHVATARTRNPSTPIVLAGDLNTTPWSPFYHQFLTDTNLLSSATGRGLTPTWYRYQAFPFGIVIDHILFSDELQCIDRQVLPDMGSDHRAVVATLRRR